MTTAADRYAEAAIEADPALPIIRITRDFKATVGQLHKAHTDPELFARWVGPDGMENEIVYWDARDGGSWRYIARRDGVDFGFRGCFHTVADDLLVQTFSYDGAPGQVALEKVTFTDLGDGYVRLVAQSLCDSIEDRDAWLASGMESGVQQGYAKLDELLADGAAA
ncbi:SRPBCC domain-containing protein [Jongsikchunia kroppenstedtii]|uniref:SRPBCC domain-containing protein n=1 Tax=Jongsikchunia kroppenstedtii TaxID=1121721 RepID=UPI000363FD40|nr:SRPBCC domain-containing protein [Jongsikchunia kroppenstedtii]